MKRTFSKEFKVKACELVLKDGIKHAVVAEKMGINKIGLQSNSFCYPNLNFFIQTQNVEVPLKHNVATTTIEALNATGIVYAVYDGGTHVSVHPIGGTMIDWYNAGPLSLWTAAVKSVIIN